MQPLIIQSVNVSTDSVGVKEMQKEHPNLCLLLSLMHGFDPSYDAAKNGKSNLDFVNAYMDLKAAKSAVFLLQRAINRIETDQAIAELTPAVVQLVQTAQAQMPKPPTT